MSTQNDATVLVVDDIVANRNLLRETLEPQGYEVLLAPSGEGALKAARRAHPDLILLDVLMPDSPGSLNKKPNAGVFKASSVRVTLWPRS
jgi:CheY-like chemotaxis protein